MKKVILVLALLGLVRDLSAQQNNTMLQIKGSDTMVNTVQVLAEKYMAKNPGKKVSVTGGGSGTGIAALQNGTCNIANSSRDIKPNEITLIKTKTLKEPVQIVLAVDGLSVIVSKTNKIKQLTIEQLGRIYRGEVTNWKEVGGADAPISLYGRQANSGTYDFFRDHVVKANYSKRVKEMNGNAQIVESVKNANKASGIGYVGAGYVQNSKNVKVLSIAKATNEKAYQPTKSNVLKGTYPISRNLYQYISGNVTTAEKDFIVFELSTEGQKIIAEEGFFPIKKEDKKKNALALGIKTKAAKKS
jgi:phosphate transport system substrate-binding protein